MLLAGVSLIGVIEVKGNTATVCFEHNFQVWDFPHFSVITMGDFEIRLKID